jgi:hypothetical protein
LLWNSTAKTPTKIRETKSSAWQACVVPNEQVAVDYAKSAEEVFADAALKTLHSYYRLRQEDDGLNTTCLRLADLAAIWVG